MRTSVGQYFAGLPIPSARKAEIRAVCLDSVTSREKVEVKSLPTDRVLGGRTVRVTVDAATGKPYQPLSNLTYSRRIALHDAIFAVENAIESRGDGCRDNPTVVALNQARNRVLDDLGWNES